MKDKWHRKLPSVKVIEKGVLHLDQTNSVEKETKEREEKEEIKKGIRKGKRRRKSSFLMVFQRSNSESSKVKKRAELRSKR